MTMTTPMSLKKSLLIAVLLLGSLSVSAQRAFDNNFIHYTDSVGLVYLDQPVVTLPAQAQAENVYSLQKILYLAGRAKAPPAQ